MNVFQINVTSNVGSTGRIAEGIGNKILSQGWESHIAYGRKSSESQSHSVKIGSFYDSIRHVAQSRLLDMHGLGSSMATRAFISKLNIEKPDIIHLHNIHGYYLNYKILFEYLRKIHTPVVWTLHDCWPITGHCAYFDLVGCEKWKTLCYSCPQIRTYPKSLFTDHSSCNYNLKKEIFTSVADRLTLVPVSMWLEGYIKSSFLKDCQISVIHNGINVSLFSPTYSGNIGIDMSALKDKTIILGVANPWSKRKGLDDFFKLSNLLPSDEYSIILVGLSTKQMRNLPANIIGIKTVHEAKDLAYLYSISNVLVNPTYEDNYPTVNLEAISCGTPVITYNTGGSPESIVENQTGFIVEKGNLTEVVKAIDFIKNRGKESFVHPCRSYAENHFDQNICFEKYIELYQSLLKNTKI